MSASHLLGLQGPQQTPAVYIVYQYFKILFYSISRSGKTAIADGDEVETEPAPSLDDIKDIKLPKVEQDESKKSINYGYHPIIDFFGNFRFDTA